MYNIHNKTRCVIDWYYIHRLYICRKCCVMNTLDSCTHVFTASLRLFFHSVTIMCRISAWQLLTTCSYLLSSWIPLTLPILSTWMHMSVHYNHLHIKDSLNTIPVCLSLSYTPPIPPLHTHTHTHTRTHTHTHTHTHTDPSLGQVLNISPLLPAELTCILSRLT